MSAIKCSDLHLVIVAGGYGTRIAEETMYKPKPMIEIGGYPILWHIMKYYEHFGVTDFIICLGYKGHVIREYFANFMLHSSDVTMDLQSGEMQFHACRSAPWRVTLVDTGLDTMTGGRLKRVGDFLPADKPFLFTYGDGLSDVNIAAVLQLHQQHGKLATLTSVAPPNRYGVIHTDDNHQITQFAEKPHDNQGRINGGFFVLEKKVLDYIEGDSMPFEQDPLVNLTRDRQLMAYPHSGFWQPMDSVRDKKLLERYWHSGAPWKVWSD